MSRVRNPMFTEVCNTRNHDRAAQDGIADSRDKTSPIQSAPTRESASRNERDEVVWSAVLGYN